MGEKSLWRVVFAVKGVDKRRMVEGIVCASSYGQAYQKAVGYLGHALSGRDVTQINVCRLEADVFEL